jgi:hypothetical protein
VLPKPKAVPEQARHRLRDRPQMVSLETPRSHSATHVSNFDTSMASTHSIREQTKLQEPNLPSPNTRLIFVWGWWQLGQ